MRIPIKRYEKVKRFNGKPYKFIDRHDTKKSAEGLAKVIRAKGNLARVVKTKKYGYEVWACYGKR